MAQSKSSLVRSLVPKSYHFDGYNEIKCPNTRDKPFFADNVIAMGEKNLTTRFIDQNTIELEFESVCSEGRIIFRPFKLTLEQYVEKLKEAMQTGSDFITFEITPYCSCNHTIPKHCPSANKDCAQLVSKKPKHVYAAVSFNSTEVKKALASYYEITKTTNGGKSSMKKNNNLFGMNFELGVSKDTNIAATLMGVAVINKESGNWYTFDTATNSRKNLANFKMGNFPIFLLPTSVLIPGDLVKINGKYYYVKAVNPNKTLTMIDAANGIIQEMLPEENIILGMTMYTKVVAFDTKTLTDPSSNQGLGGNVLAAVCMMQWAKGNEDEFSLDNIRDDSFGGLGEYLPLILASGNSFGGMFNGADGNVDMAKLITLGAISGNSENDGMTQMLILSQLLGGGNNMFASMGVAPAAATVATTDSVVCEKCGKSYPNGTNFCSVCGGKTKSVSTTCRKCGATLEKDAAFCSNCGAKVGISTCSKCGKEVVDDAKFCSACGNNLCAPEVAKTTDVSVEQA